MGMEKEQIELINSAFLVILPGMFLVSYLATIWLNILIIRNLLARKGIALKSVENLNQYRVPEFLVWVVILLGLTLLSSLEVPKYISINCLLVLMLVYFFQGNCRCIFLF